MTVGQLYFGKGVWKERILKHACIYTSHYFVYPSVQIYVAMSEAFYSSIEVIIIILLSPLLIITLDATAFLLLYCADIKLSYECQVTALTFTFVAQFLHNH